MGTFTFLAFTFSASGAFIFFRQPQFSAFFGLVGAAFGEVILTAHGIPNSDATWLLAPLIWLLLFQHPIQLGPGVFRTVATFGLGLSTLMAVPHALTLPMPRAMSIAVILLTAAGFVVLSHRCLQTGVLASPRTMIFALSMAPLICASVIANLAGIKLSNTAVVVLNLIVGLAPIGCIIYEIILSRSQKESVHEPA